MKAESFKEGIKRLRRYARYLQKMGYDVSLNNVKVLPASAFHAFDGHINIRELGGQRAIRYQPELFLTATFKRENVTFICFRNGKVVNQRNRQISMTLFIKPTPSLICIHRCEEYYLYKEQSEGCEIWEIMWYTPTFLYFYI